MRLIIVAGTPSSGKTAVMLHTIRWLREKNVSVSVCKIDCLKTCDDARYRKLGIPVAVGLSDYICPDHFYVANLEEIWNWADALKTGVLVLETAGLCHRCAPALHDCFTICVIDNLVGLGTPEKLGPMLGTADIVVITKGDIVSQAERELFRHEVETVNPGAAILNINGLTGQGSLRLKSAIMNHPPIDGITGRALRYPMPAAVCSYCAGETIVGSAYQMGNLKKIDFGKADKCWKK